MVHTSAPLNDLLAISSERLQNVKSRTEFIPGQVSGTKDSPEKFRMDGHLNVTV